MQLSLLPEDLHRFQLHRFFFFRYWLESFAVSFCLIGWGQIWETIKSAINILSIIQLNFIANNYYFRVGIFMFQNEQYGYTTQYPLDISKIVDTKITENRLKTRLKIIQKIINSVAWIKKDKFTDSLFYDIQKFVFPNPLCFVTPIYKQLSSQSLKIQAKKTYILINSGSKQKLETNIIIKNSINSTKDKISREQTQKYMDNSQNQKQQSYAVCIKIKRCWKGCKFYDPNLELKEIIQKSKHLIDFLKNIRIENPKQSSNPNDKYLHAQNSGQKESNLYTLVCQNYDYIYSKISQIQQKQKQKRLDASILKTYIEIMTKNMIILTVEKNNYNPISHKSEGKFIYLQNNLNLPLFNQRFQKIYAQLDSFKIEKSQLDLIPYLQCNMEGQWRIQSYLRKGLQIFQEGGKQVDRGHGVIVDRFLNYFQYDDFLIKKV